MEQNVSKKQNRKMTVFAVLLSVISIGLLVFGFFMVSSDKVILLQSVSNLTAKLDSVYEDNKLLDKISSSNTVGVRSNISASSELLNLDGSISLDYLENRKDKQSKLSLGLNYDNQKLLDLDTILANDNVYLFIKDITPKYYFTALEYYSMFSNLNSDDYETMVDLITDSINANFEKSDIKKEKVTIKYDGKDKKVNKLTYKIDSKFVYNVLKELTDGIKKEKTLLKHLAESANISSDEIVKGLEDLLSEFKDIEDTSSIDYVVYYYGFNKIVQYELGNNEFTIQYKDGNSEELNLIVEGQTLFNITSTKNKNNYDIKGYVNTSETEKFEFTGTVVGDTLTLSFDVEGATLKVKIKDTFDDKNYTEITNIVISTEISTLEQEIIQINMKNEYYFDGKIDTNLDNSVDISEISEEDSIKIMENVENNPLYQTIIELLNNFDFSMLENFEL